MFEPVEGKSLGAKVNIDPRWSIVNATTEKAFTTFEANGKKTFNST